MKTRFFTLLLVIIFVFPLTAADHIKQAWQAWQENKQEDVQKYFTAALEENPAEIRAALGLALLYDMQKKPQEAWYAFKTAIKITNNPNPYLFAAWLMPFIRENYDVPESGVIEFLKQLAQSADPMGILRVMADERLGTFYQEKGAYSEAQAYFNNLGALNQWMVIGPFDNISASGFEKIYPPEQEFDESKTYLAKNGVPAHWFEITKVRRDYWIDFLRYFAYDEAIFYANNFIYSPVKQKVQIRIGTSGSLKCFLNHDQLIEYFDENNNDVDTYIVETELQKGWNRLLIKCGYSEINRCNFLVRITDSQGYAIDNISVDTKKHDYPINPGAPAHIIENFAELFFKELISKNPDHFENYVLLAQCYLRNDKAVEAEMVLRKAIEKSPNCALFYYHIIEAYIRGEKADELATTTEKVYNLDKKIPRIIARKINLYLDNEEFYNAEKSLEMLNELLPESEYYYEFLISYYLTKKEYEKLQEVNDLAYQKYPNNWTFVYYKAIFAVRALRSHEQAISTLETYLASNIDISSLSTLSDIYLQSSNITGWENTYKRIFEFDPAAVGYYYQVANDYFQLRNYDMAEEMVRQAISICPNSSAYWALLGDISRAKNDLLLAQENYKKSLKYNKADYDTREKLRKLEGKPPIFDHFEKTNLDSIIAQAPGKELYPGVKAIVLLRNANRVVYPEGASESTEELLVRVFNKRGIDDFKEFRISHNRYTEGLTIEKAAVIKRDGSEVPADSKLNLIVFKSLEEEDFIYVKWRLKNYYNGKLSEHFWDKFYFNSNYPMEKVSYALLIPKDFKFSHSTQNMDIEPEIRHTEDGDLYIWRSENVSSMGFEHEMPGIDDIGKVLYISSIGDWAYLVDWYNDLAKTRTRSSYEIKETIADLFSGKENLSKEDKIKIIYNYITENIRYSHIPFRQSGLIPQKARDVLVTKIGDCKDTATLCIAMLKEVDIDAHYILVNTRNEGLNKNALPSISFNHCITAVETDNGPLYLDLTANNYPLGSVPDLDINAFSLKIKDGVEAPNYLTRDYFISRDIFRKSVIEVTDENRLIVKTSEYCTGAQGAYIRGLYRQKTDYDRKVLLTEILGKQYTNVELEDLEFENLDELKSHLYYSYEYEIPNYVSDAGTFKILPIPWRDKFEPEKALSYEERLYPYNYWPLVDTLFQEIEIILPDEFEPVEIPNSQSFSTDIADYTTNFSYDGRAIKGSRTLINKKIQVAPDDYADFREFYNAAVQEDARQILLKKK